MVFVHTQSNVKTVQFQSNQFSVTKVSLSKTVLFQTIPFSINTQLSSLCRTQVLLLRARVDLSVIVMKAYSAFSTTLVCTYGEVLWHISICISLLRVISRLPIGGLFSHCRGAVCVFYYPTRLSNAHTHTGHKHTLIRTHVSRESSVSRQKKKKTLD